MDTATLIALAAVVINAISYLIAIFQFREQQATVKSQFEQQRKDTQELVVLTKKLEHRVNRLSTELHESLNRLHRAHEVASEAHRLGHQAILGSKVPVTEDVSHGDIGKLVACLAELEAIAEMEGSPELIGAARRISSIMHQPISQNPMKNPDEVNERWRSLSEAVKQAHEIIFRLEIEVVRKAD